MMNDTKQVIVIRKDLGIRRGKEIAQSCHASMSFITKQLQNMNPGLSTLRFVENQSYFVNLNSAQIHWMNNSFRKITCQVQTEQELLDIHQKALDAGLESHIILDNGQTEFNLIPTYTAVAIGPDWDDKIDAVTGGLKLY
jgi:PTH2 family peptidyl-tRNA hydrolase